MTSSNLTVDTVFSEFLMKIDLDMFLNGKSIRCTLDILVEVLKSWVNGRIENRFYNFLSNALNV